MTTIYLGSRWVFLLLPWFSSTCHSICTSPSGVFTVEVDLYASELGYYRFKECGNIVNPTIGLEMGVKYRFLQHDRTNWMHPLGFAYFPDGDHSGRDELETTVTQTGSNCAETFTCPHPRYYKNGEFLGVPFTENFGLDEYEPLFFASPQWFADWFAVELVFNDYEYQKDIFYFCHIHQYMSGRIKLLRRGQPVSELDRPRLGYEYDPPPGPFDQSCGTFGLEDFQTPGNPVCPERFVCGARGGPLEHFSACIDAMNCHMLDGMTTGVSSNDAVTLFIHQMIPHHQNAVNMAKVLLKEKVLQCEDLSNEDNQDCIMERVLIEIVNTQNHQIQQMLGYLEAFNLPETDNCVVIIDTLAKIIEGPADYTRDNQVIAGLAVAPPPPKSNSFLAKTSSILLVTAVSCLVVMVLA